MKLFLAFVVDLDTDFHFPTHCQASDDFEVRIRLVEGQYGEISLVRRQTGLGFLTAAQPKCVLVSWSANGLPSEARLLARGRITEMPGDLLGPRQTLSATCAPGDIDERLLEFAKAQLAGDGPETDWLYSDADMEDPQSYLLGRSAVYYVDPATHEISISDDLVGDREVDLGAVALFEDGRATGGLGEYGKLVKTLRGKISVAFTQQVSGTCDVAGAVGPIETLDPSFGGSLPSLLTAEVAEGWALGGGGYDYSVTKDDSALIDLGTRYESRTKFDSELGGLQDRILDHSLYGRLTRFRVNPKTLPMAFEYSQERIETAFLALDLPIQPTGFESDTDEVVEFSLRDIFQDPELLDYVPQQNYKFGDQRRYNGRRYYCLGDHFSTGFGMSMPRQVTVPVSGGRVGSLSLRAYVTYWRLIEVVDDLQPGIYSFFETGRGRRVIRHGMMRIRKEGRRRLRALRVTMRFAWADAIHLKLTDSIRFFLPFNEGLRSVVGKVVSIDATWPEVRPKTPSSPTVTVEAAISFGVDADVMPGAGPYVEDGYVDEDYVEGGEHITDSADLFYAVEFEPVQKPINVGALRNAAYSVVSVRTGNRFSTQFSTAAMLGVRGGDVRKAATLKPTWAAIKMRSLAAYSPLVREIDVVGVLARAPTGVSLE